MPFSLGNFQAVFLQILFLSHVYSPFFVGLQLHTLDIFMSLTLLPNFYICIFFLSFNLDALTLRVF